MCASTRKLLLLLPAVAAGACGGGNMGSAEPSLDAQAMLLPEAGAILLDAGPWTAADASVVVTEPVDAADPSARDSGAVEDAAAATPDCGAGTLWSGGTGWTMAPGEACISCHDESIEAPRFVVAGTVFDSAHVPDRCDGTPAMPSVEITDAMGVVHMLTASAAGNFGWVGTLALPYQARILYQGRTRAMTTPQTRGDCNACHTESGANGAPGRIQLP